MEIKEIEQFINQIKSVNSSKIVIDENDNITEMHILSDTKRSPKQISRDVQSGLISKFGIEIDHKKISIAQIDDLVIQNKDFRLKLNSIEISTSGMKASIKVLLEKDGNVFEGNSYGANTTYNSHRLIAKAALNSVENFLEIEDNLILEDITFVKSAGKDIVVSVVSFINNYSEQVLCGCALINSNMNEAIIKATLDAVNRKIIKCYNEG